MLALIYFILAICVGDFLCRRFYRFVSIAHRFAAAILVGLLVSSWFTYLAGLAFFQTSRPLLWANLLFFVTAVALLSWPRWKRTIRSARTGTDLRHRTDLYLPRSPGSSIADWVLIAGYAVLVSWMMFASFNSAGGRLKIANPEYSDFGPNTAIMQSFAVGHNFPTEYPHFSGDRIRYHFLFYFQAGNLEFLGLDPAWSLNLLSITTLVAMLIVATVLGEVVFNSRAVGRLGSLLFFFFGSLSYVPFLQKQGSVRATIQAISHQREYLPTIFPYRGELWGTWSQVTYLNQRHFASAIGILLLVLLFLVIRYRMLSAKQPRAQSLADSVVPQPDALAENAPDTLSDHRAPSESVSEPKAEMPPVSLVTEAKQETGLPSETFRATLPGFIFSGVLLGLLPMWNSAVFIAAAAVLGCLFLLFPLRGQMLLLAISAGVMALPQMLYLSTGSGRAPMPRLLHWGYMVDQPTAANVAKYLGFIFGFKWLLIALALIFASWFQRRLFLAALSLLGVAFCFQFTIEVLANQKFLHIWVIIANLFVAFALWRLWRFSLGGTMLPGKSVATILFLLVIPGGVVDFFPIHNTGWSEVTYKNDPLIDWLKKNTTPRDIFLTDRFVNHPILMAGRRVLYGWPYYGWSAGYNASKHDRLYTDLFENKDPWKVYHLLKENGISYVAYDNAVQQGQFIKHPNQQLYATYFPKVFEDSRYNRLVIYKVPDTPPPKLTALPEAVTNMFEGGRGAGKGEFDSPTGIAVDPSGNILVADTNNGRIEKFSPTGIFLGTVGTKGTGHGQLEEPNGIAVDRGGNIYVAEVASNHRVQKLAPDGTFIAEWKGPDVGFYGPRRIAIGPDDSVYVVDQGRTRIVKFSPDEDVLSSWGSKGSGDGQFDDPTSVAVDSTSGRAYVADPINKRIQVFDQNGKFLTKWVIPEWGRPAGFEDLAIDSKAGRLYGSSANMDTVLVFDLNGTRIGSLRPKPPDKLDGPSALALVDRKLYVLCMLGNRVSQIDLQTK
jgi:DNA-binding beta-propeller fold protein YncE